jgi:charged multivesicular body protein 4
MANYLPLLITIGSQSSTAYSMLREGAAYLGSSAKYVVKQLKPKGIEAQVTDFDDRTDEVSLQEGAKNAIAEVQKSIALIENKEYYLDKKIQLATKEAYEKNKAGNKKGALFALRRKKMYSMEYERLEDIHNGLVMKTMHLETMLINLEIYSTLKTAANQMKTINNGMTADSLDDALDEIHESINITEEISTVLTQPITHDTFDESELLEELESITADTISHIDTTLTEQAVEEAVAQDVPPELPEQDLPSTAIAINDLPDTDYDFPDAPTNNLLPPFDNNNDSTSASAINSSQKNGLKKNNRKNKVKV